MRNIPLVLTVMFALAGCAAQVGVEVPNDPDGAQGASEPAAGDNHDLFAGEMPPLMQQAHSRQLDGALLDLDEQRALYDYALEHDDDARPWLLLARDSMRRDWQGFALRQYASAIEADARAAVQRGVLDDLVRIAAYNSAVFEQRNAADLIVDVYSDDALPAIERALADAERAGDDAAIARLTALRTTLEG